jgi:glyoxylase-like metal-dependent hydrolase (beta-lactamase superfamily II)
MNRREFLSTAAVLALPLQQSTKLTVIDGGGANVVGFNGGDGFVLVDSGVPKSGDKIMAALGSNAKITILFNTHHHTDQTGNNEMFSAAGAKIIAHKRTLEWLSADHWVQAGER